MSKHDLLFGLHSIEAVLNNEPERILEIFALKGRDDDRMNKVISLARKHGVSVAFVAKKKLEDRADGESHQGIMANARAARVKNEADLDEIIANNEQPFLLILDGVTDPHNLGACIRSADAAGVHAVIVPKDNAASLTPVVRKVACGAAETMPLIQVTNLARTMREIQQQGIWVYGTAGEATQALYETKLTGPIAIVMGAEGSGMRRLTREHCDTLVSLPMAGSVSSLNVSVTTGICLFEVVRQRGLV
ncbi:23S rRNA (guanosine(2251)-2'-O)-methyltransferase RlmB [Psychrobium sp. 1_MG-2023]|uniref:23S rRNA (guanosine(2251)-2'-O)-methyltransferase RlmB n=1 Tax=Psychrobium sp. 1_MG-2023 TaxID=3062624 RepID=UPI000C328EC5|nr:23S rRNA (guanosine(2251)-2'-O)-methyltransferase RlmB [Psychrobium sp. 1_MG-2023]MDP2561292.1 23S rRNA (guanosine(2251)-2'-O)-methyltransferase RlmB [Psychrobium sp. 1_MG-2023]PKF54108.1 23S rRNA (guanosine(2251)-2'-O)-methyltransferase RlmB [Alteromonadales bacterium alter-6D02]